MPSLAVAAFACWCIIVGGGTITQWAGEPLGVSAGVILTEFRPKLGKIAAANGTTLVAKIGLDFDRNLIKIGWVFHLPAP